MLLGSLLLSTVLTGPAAQPDRAHDLNDPFVATEASADARVRAGTSRASADLRDPFEPEAPAIARARRSGKSRADLRDPFAPVSAGEAAAARTKPAPARPRAVPNADLLDPFAS